MANKLSDPNRFAEELDLAPSQLEDALWDHLQEEEERERNAGSWRRDLSLAALATVVVLIAMWVMW
jgi:hypothetical protein